MIQSRKGLSMNPNWLRLMWIFMCAVLLWGCQSKTAPPPEKPPEDFAAKEREIMQRELRNER